MQIYTNVAAMNASRMFNRNQSSVSTAVQRLSTGLRINSARDDAAGLSISERMTSQIRGMNVGARNVNDGVSLLQTAEAGLQEVGNMVQRIRELAVQAANTAVLSVEDRRKLQLESDELVKEVTRIAKNTDFNGVKILNDNVRFGAAEGDAFALVDALHRSWLQQSEDTITTYFGLTASGADLTIDLTGFSDGVGNTLARATASVGAGVGNATNQSIQFDMTDFVGVGLPNGGTGPLYNDRVINHEMVHAVMYNQVDTSILNKWFMEGTAEFIHGADERVAGDGGATAVIAGSNISGGAWGGASIDYSKAYLAVRYLHLKAGGFTAGNAAASGIGQIMDELKGGATLDQAINTATGGLYADEATFLADFDTNGEAYLTAHGLDLGNTDTGAIGGSDAEDGTGARAGTSAEDVVPDVNENLANPTGFNVIFPFDNYTAEGPTQYLSFQVGANKGETIDVAYAAASASALGIENIDLVGGAQSALGTLDDAIGYITKQRARLGAQQNRLQHALQINAVSAESLTASRSRIQDADYAAESAAMTKGLIIAQAATAMVSQAQAVPKLALSLLNQSF